MCVPGTCKEKNIRLESSFFHKIFTQSFRCVDRNIIENWLRKLDEAMGFVLAQPCGLNEDVARSANLPVDFSRALKYVADPADTRNAANYKALSESKKQTGSWHGLGVYDIPRIDGMGISEAGGHIHRPDRRHTCANNGGSNIVQRQFAGMRWRRSPVSTDCQGEH